MKEILCYPFLYKIYPPERDLEKEKLDSLTLSWAASAGLMMPPKKRYKHKIKSYHVSEEFNAHFVGERLSNRNELHDRLMAISLELAH